MTFGLNLKTFGILLATALIALLVPQVLPLLACWIIGGAVAGYMMYHLMRTPGAPARGLTTAEQVAIWLAGARSYGAHALCGLFNVVMFSRLAALYPTANATSERFTEVVVIMVSLVLMLAGFALSNMLKQRANAISADNAE